MTSSVDVGSSNASSRLRSSSDAATRRRPRIERVISLPSRPSYEWSLFSQLMSESSSGSSTLRRRNALYDTTDHVILPSSHIQRLSSEPDAISQSLHDDSDTESASDSLAPPQQTPPSWLSAFHLTRIQKNVLKCSLAYLIASLFTLVPYLSGFLSHVPTRGHAEGPSASGHMVATVVVYFNPAKTIGAMIEADIYFLFGLAFSAFVSLASMAMFWYFEVQPGWEWLADALVLSWLAGAIIIVAWLKVWLARPSFNVACSMMCIIIFVVIVREGGLQTLLQVSFNVLVGAIISNITCLYLWTESASSNLQSDMSSALSAFSTLLTTLTRTFLLDPDFHPKQSTKLQKAIEAHQKSFTSLKRNLTEAHSEWLGTCAGTDKGKAYDDAVDCLNRLAQHLGGLRSGTRLQADLTSALREGKITLSSRRVEELGRNAPGQAKAPTTSSSSRDDDEERATLTAAAAMFGDLVDDLGPPMSALSSTCTRTLDRLQAAFDVSPTSSAQPLEGDEFVRLADEVERALFAFDSTANHAVMRLYRRSDMTDEVGVGVALGVIDEEGKAGGSDNETVFLVYFFIFTIQEFARELILLISAMARIYALETRETTWEWLTRLACIGRIWSRRKAYGDDLSGSASELLDEGDKPKLRKRFSKLFHPTFATNSSSHPTFPRVKPHAPNTIQTPARSSLTTLGRINQSLWSLLTHLRSEPSIKYSLKTGLACAILASPAFISPTSRDLFLEYRGEWALLSFFVVISPVIGQTNMMSVQRVLGTMLGAIVAVGVFWCFDKWPVALAVCGFLFSVPCFWAILTWGADYAPGVRLVLLTYNLTCLYTYNTRHDDFSVFVVGFRRATAVIIGVVWAFIVSQFWWPTEARRELGKALSEFCFNIGWLYGRLVVNYSCPPEPLLRLQQGASMSSLPSMPIKLPSAGGRRHGVNPFSPSGNGGSSLSSFAGGNEEVVLTPIDERTPLLKGNNGGSGGGAGVSAGGTHDGSGSRASTPMPVTMPRLTPRPSYMSDMTDSSIATAAATTRAAVVTTPGGRKVRKVSLPPHVSDVLVKSIHDFMAMELHLQHQLIKLQELLNVTQHEPRLKGPFPVKLYRSILTSLQSILDKLHSMRCVTTRAEWYTTVRRDFIAPVTKERRELVGNVILYFSVLASAFKLKAPLPPFLPPAEKSRQELVNAIRRLDAVKARNVKGSRQLLYFAYALMMKGVIHELDFLGKTLQEAFGVLGGSKENFENMFKMDLNIDGSAGREEEMVGEVGMSLPDVGSA